MAVTVSPERSPSVDAEELYRIRHSAAHIMAQAVLELFPQAKLAIGPPVENGFYYDFQLPRSLTPDDLAIIEEYMRRIIAEDHPITYRVVAAAEAEALCKDQPFKLELIHGLIEDPSHPTISTYRQDTFED